MLAKLLLHKLDMMQEQIVVAAAVAHTTRIHTEVAMAVRES
jgi:hypothetical protein